jgi:hypothetical protein
MSNNAMLPSHRTNFAGRLDRQRKLTPEEDAIIGGDDDDGDGFDPTLPADLWFRTRRHR